MNSSFVFARVARGGFLSVVIMISLLLSPVSGRSAEIVINEIMAANSSVAPLTALPDYFPDYVELYNTTSTNIDLNAGGWTLSNKRAPLAVDFKDFYSFPPGTVIPANDYLLVFFDDKTNNPGLHTSYTINGTNITFTLKGSGDRVQLYKNETTLVDSNIFGIQIDDYSIGRFPSGTGDFTLNVPTPCGGTRPCTNNIAAAFVPAPSASSELTLKINEWLVFNTSGGKTNDDWFEIYNPDTNIVSLSGLIFVDRGYDSGDLAKPENQIPPLSFIAPLGFVKLIADDEENDENSNIDDADTMDFSLSSTSALGDMIYMFASNRATIIDQVTLPGPFTTPNVSRGRIPDGATNIVTLPNLSPGGKNFGTITEIVISEVLPHTDLPFDDAIELQNVSSNTVDISHWWLTNNEDVPKKFRIPANTILPPGGFAVFYEGRGTSTGFNRNGSGNSPYFTLNSARGDELYLFKGNPDGSITGDRRGIDFGASENGVSFGRYTKSDGSSDIVAMSQRTFGQDNPTTISQFHQGTGKTNAYPKVGPLIINEVHYHPPNLPGNIENDVDEFVEIRNISDNTVLLYDPLFPTNQWRLKDAVSFDFPTNQSLAPDEFALIVNFDPATNAAQLAVFNATFPNIPAGTKIFGPYKGKLSDAGATVELAWPDRPQAAGRVDAGLVPFVVVDRLKYNDKSPWPTNADGAGLSLQRIAPLDYGNDVINWKGEAPTPGQFNSSLGIEPPRITAEPQSHTVLALRNTSFSLTVRGGPRSYQWLFNGTNLVDATNTTLQLIGVATNQAGPYQVILSNAAGSVTSAVATLTVTPSAADLTKPTVAITSPKASARVTNATLTISGTASDKVALNRVEYRVGNGSFQTASGTTAWSAQVTLEPGTNFVSARSFDTSLNISATNTIAVIYVVPSALTLSTTGSGTVTGATNGQMLEVGRGYTLTATPATGQVFSNWTGDVSSASPKLTFLMASNLSLSANFVPNPFRGVAGKFSGLFYDTNAVLHGSSGFFTLTTTDRGTYTAALLAGGLKLSASGQLDLEGRATSTILRKGTNALTVTWAVALDGSDQVTGTVRDSATNWIAELNGDRATFNAKTNACTLAGKYTLLLPGLPGDAFVPGGTSYGTVSIDSNGVAALKGFLSDKTSAAQKVPLSKNGEWPLYIPLYSGKGSLLSWIAFTNRAGDDFHGLLNWSKPALAKAKYYPAGFNTNLNEAIGARYTPPAGTNKILNLTDATLTLSGGNLAQDYTNAFTLGLSSKVTNGGPHGLKLTFTTSSGLFKGSLTPTNAGARAIAINGAVLQKGTNAAGYFLGTNHSGTVSIQPAP